MTVMELGIVTTLAGVPVTIAGIKNESKALIIAGASIMAIPIATTAYVIGASIIAEKKSSKKRTSKKTSDEA